MAHKTKTFKVLRFSTEFHTGILKGNNRPGLDVPQVPSYVENFNLKVIIKIEINVK